MPNWLLPQKLPEFIVKGSIRHAPMIDARAIAITTYNENRRRAREAGLSSQVMKIPKL